MEQKDNIPSVVSSLGNGCFSNSIIETITIPNTITTLENNCFDKCFNLSSIVLPNSLTDLSGWCFSICTSLSTITIPSSIISIGNECFRSCWSLESIIISNSVNSIGSYCFSSCTSLKSILIPSSVSILENGTFNSCSSLTNVELPNNLISIGNHCFEYCTSLTNILLPTKLQLIGQECFLNCEIESISIPKSIKSISVNCFLCCTSLTNLSLESNENEFPFEVSYADSILYKQFGIDCSNVVLTQHDVRNQIALQKNSLHYDIQKGINSIGDWTFTYREKIKSITIPTTVTSLCNGCFHHCSGLTSISLPTTVKLIGTDCFRACNSLRQLSVPLNNDKKYPFKVSYSEYLVFNKCNVDCKKVIFDNGDNTHYKSIPTDVPLILNVNFVLNTSEEPIPSNVISLKSNYLSTKITSIKIPTSVTYLCDDCFKNYSNLKSITIPTTVKYIGKHLIDGCTSLTKLDYEGDWNDIVVSYTDHLRYKSIGFVFNNIEYTKEDKIKYGNVIPSFIHSIHKSYYNRFNETFYIPTHITSLDNNMFDFHNISSKIQTIIIPTSITTIPKHCFSKCYLLTYVSLPSTLTSIKKKSFSNCISLQSIIIPSSVITIEQYAFENCYSLTRIVFSTTIEMKSGCFRGCNQLRDIPNISTTCF